MEYPSLFFEASWLCMKSLEGRKSCSHSESSWLCDSYVACLLYGFHFKTLWLEHARAISDDVNTQWRKNGLFPKVVSHLVPIDRSSENWSSLSQHQQLVEQNGPISIYHYLSLLHTSCYYKSFSSTPRYYALTPPKSLQMCVHHSRRLIFCQDTMGLVRPGSCRSILP